MKGKFDEYFSKNTDALPLSISQLIESEHKSPAFVLSQYPSTSLEQLPTEDEFNAKQGNSAFLLFRTEGIIKGGMAKYRFKDGVFVLPNKTLKVFLSEKESEQRVLNKSIILYPMTDLYGCIKIKVTDANRSLFTQLDQIQGDGSVAKVERQFVESKLVSASIDQNKVLVNVTALNPGDLLPGNNLFRITSFL